jgi:hypothetical protein
MKLDALIHWYERLTPARLGEIDQLYHEGASFRDPFNDVQGQPAIEAIFRHMFNTTGDPRFEVTDRRPTATSPG